MVHVPSIFLASVGGCPSRFDMKCDEAGYRYGSSETKIFIVLPCNITLFSLVAALVGCSSEECILNLTT